MRSRHHDVTDVQVMSPLMVVRPARAQAPGGVSMRSNMIESSSAAATRKNDAKGSGGPSIMPRRHHGSAATETPGPRLPEFSKADYFAFFFNVSIRTLAAGPEEAGFWPVISWPSVTV